MRQKRHTKTRISNRSSIAMGAFNESLMKAGALLSGERLADDMSEAFVVDFSA
jgi:hypothetical protein